MLVPAPDATVDGLLLRAASRRDILRLNHFESGEYHAELRPVRTRDGAHAARLALRGAGRPAGVGRGLEDEDWRRRHLADFLPACDAWMADWPEGEG